MNYRWALDRVNEYLELLTSHRNTYRQSEGVSAEQRRHERTRLAHDIDRKLPTIIKIAQRAEPGIVDNFMFEDGGGEWPYGTRLKVTHILLGALEDAEQVDANLGPVGPRLSDVELHPWVLTASRDLWDGGHRREAIQAASTQLEHHMRAKLGVADGSGTNLSVAFAADPPTNKQPRLRLPGFASGTEDFTSAHEGAKFLGMGCFRAIRNIATHSDDQPDEDRALEMLTTLSLLARWVEESTVETA